MHEEYQDADILKFVPPPVPDPADSDRLARDVVDFTVYVAGGSHATYLTSGTHDLVDFQDTWGYVDENAPCLYVIAPVILAVSIILAIIEHLVDTEDFTSEEGVHAGPDDVVAEHPGKVAAHVLTLRCRGETTSTSRGTRPCSRFAPTPASGAARTGSSTRARPSRRRPAATSANSSTSSEGLPAGPAPTARC